jgi:ribose transport system ATP-binding protein
LFGLERTSEGTLTVFGSPLPLSSVPRARIAAGIGYLSEDRKREGLALPLSMADNISLTNFSACSQGGWIDLNRQRQYTHHCAEAVGVRAPNMNSPVGQLSGGNQQKVALARLLHQHCEIFLLDEPTRGVDVGSKAQIYERIVSLAAAGKSVLLVSSYLPELLGICDRLAVMRRGCLGPALPISDWTPETVMQAAIYDGPSAVSEANS